LGEKEEPQALELLLIHCPVAGRQKIGTRSWQKCELSDFSNPEVGLGAFSLEWV
jgi:hypothetical protein